MSLTRRQLVVPFKTWNTKLLVWAFHFIKNGYTQPVRQENTSFSFSKKYYHSYKSKIIYFLILTSLLSSNAQIHKQNT